MPQTHSIRRALLVPIALVLLAAPASAGVVLDLVTQVGDDRDPMRLSVDGERLRMDMELDAEGNPDTSMIYRGDRREMLIIDHDERSVMRIDEDTVQSLGGEVNTALQDAMQQMEEQLKNMPPEQRKMVEGMMKGQLEQLKKSMGGANGGGAEPEIAIEVKRIGDRRNVAGYGCVTYEMWRGSSKESELCVADRGDVPGGPEAYEAFRDMADFASDLFDSFREQAPMLQGLIDQSALRFGNPFSEIGKIGGIPVHVRDLENGSVESETFLEAATERSLASETFEPPAGYKQRSMRN